MKTSMKASLLGICLLTATVAHASWPAAGWKGPFDIRAVSSQVSLSGNYYFLNFYINGAAESGSWCGSDTPLKFYWQPGNLDASLASAKSAQANVLSAFLGGYKVKVKFKGADGCAIDDVLVCQGACDPT